MFTSIIDRFAGYIDNFRSDDHFQNLNPSALNYSASRIQGWTNHNLLLVNADQFSKKQTKSLNTRIQLWNETQLIPNLSKLSKSQILYYKDNTSYLTQLSLNKVCKLVVTKKLQQPTYVNYAWENCNSDPEKRTLLLSIIAPQSDIDFSKLTPEDFEHLLLRDFSFVKKLQPHFLVGEKTDKNGEYVTDSVLILIEQRLFLDNLSYVLDLEETVRQKLYRKDFVIKKEELFHHYVELEARNGNFDFITKIPHRIFTQYVKPVMEAYVLNNTFAKASFKVDYTHLQHLWENSTPRLKHFLKHLITEEFFDKLAKAFPSNLYEILGEDKYFEFIKNSNKETIAHIWNYDNFIKNKFLKGADLKQLLPIAHDELSENDWKIVIARDPVYVSQQFPSKVKALASFVVKAALEKGINLDQLPKEFSTSVTAVQIEENKFINTLEEDLRKLEGFTVQHYPDAKVAFENKLKTAQKLNSTKLKEIESRWKELNEEDDDNIFSFFGGQIIVSKNLPENISKLNKEVLAKATANNIDDIYRLKELGLYSKDANGNPEFAQIFQSLKTLVDTL